MYKRQELLKVKHTSFWKIHAAMPLIGALLFALYFLLYGSVDGGRKLKLILELTVVVFPLLIGVIVGLNVLQEERASHFQTLLAVPNRGRMFLAKLIVLYGAGAAALGCLYALFLLALGLTGDVYKRQAFSCPAPVIPIGFLMDGCYLLHFFCSKQHPPGMRVVQNRPMLFRNLTAPTIKVKAV